MKNHLKTSTIINFRKKTDKMYHIIYGYDTKEIEELVYSYVKAQIEEYDIQVDILEVLVGSRSRGIEHLDSDIDILIYFDSTE